MVDYSVSSINFLSLSFSCCSQVLALGFDERFLRIWEFYLIYSAAGFKSRAVGDYQVDMYICVHVHTLFPDRWR
jgi:hypothetical protein